MQFFASLCGIFLQFISCEYNAGMGFIFRLPIETAETDELVAEGTSSNKKDAVMACAVEACKLIQAYDMMQNKCKGRRVIDVQS